MLLRLCFSDGWECGTVSGSGWDCHSPSSFVRLNGLVKHVTFFYFCFFFLASMLVIDDVKILVLALAFRTYLLNLFFKDN